MAKLNLIDTQEELNKLSSLIEHSDFIAYDCETTGLRKGSEVIGFSVCFNEIEAFYVILKAWDKETQTLVTKIPLDAAKAFLERLKGEQLVMHNSVFDCGMAEDYFKVNLIDSVHTDTMILAHLLNENRRVGLKELAKEYFGADSTKEAEEMKASVIANGGEWSVNNKELFKAESRLLGLYGAQDALLTYRLFLSLVSELYEQGLDKFFYEDESMPLLRGPTYQLNTTGLKLEETARITLQKILEAECEEAKHFIYTEINKHVAEKYPGSTAHNKFNIGSPQQLSWLLFGKLGLEFGALTDTGRVVCKSLGLKLPYAFSAKRDFIARCERTVGQVYQPEGRVNGRLVKAKKIREPWCYIASDKKTLTKLAPKYKWIEKLLDYQRKMKILNTYVKPFGERVQYGIIRPSFLQHGTTSGRYASRNPNFQNLPRDDKRVKACIVARPEKVFVGADYSQLEPRVFAYFSKDERLLKAFNGKSDFYSTIGMEVYSKYDCTPQKDGSPDAFGVKYKKLRDSSKVIALASTYGATAHQLASTTGKSVEETQQDINNYFEQFPGVKQLMTDSHEMAKQHGQVTNLFGRPRRMPDAKKINKLYGPTEHRDLPYEVRNMLNLAVNHRIQSTAASIVNRAAIAFHKYCLQLSIDCKLVAQVHDSLVVECNEADSDTVAGLLQLSMEETVILDGVKLEAIPKIGKTLADV